ncbi:hypothetical protein M3172_20685 [Mesobacillus subterraneus]|uniref:hypothetical protein n=1 Tax=Mesobacillus subterraneus TaxID=285983 RepID=UPI00203BAD79|nr:hypothetical protein [Mesobacillus subterraneus]MCM3575613.1 hypothetical protein [Mesobacillus subterraneus]
MDSLILATHVIVGTSFVFNDIAPSGHLAVIIGMIPILMTMMIISKRMKKKTMTMMKKKTMTMMKTTRMQGWHRVIICIKLRMEDQERLTKEGSDGMGTKIYDEKVSAGPKLNKGHGYIAVHPEGKDIAMMFFSGPQHKTNMNLTKEEAKELIQLLVKYV